MRLFRIILIAGLLSPAAIRAEPANGYAISVATRPLNLKLVRVRFTDALDNTAFTVFTTANVKLIARPSGTDIVPGKPEPTSSSDFAIDIPYTGEPKAGDTTIDVTFTTVTFADQHIAGPLSGHAAISPAAIAAAMQAVLEEIHKTPRTDSDRSIMASGFVTTASGGTHGGADVILNSIDLGVPGMNSFLQIKKSSVKDGDPKNFEAGMRFRHAFVHNAAKFTQIRALLDEYRQTHNEALLTRIKTIQDELQKRTLAATLLDFAAKFEGEATKFNVSNAVGDFSVKLQTMTKSLGGSTHGFWRLRVIPVGFEGGRNLNTTGNTDTTTAAAPKPPDVEWIARAKVGSEFALFYDNPKSALPAKRVELAAGVVERYLFAKETRFDSDTNSILTTARGSRPWCQVDLKFFVGENASARYGFKLAYQRGSLPPVFANTKAFHFGFLYESK